MTPPFLLGGVILVALVLYALGGGADFGGGVWDLLATGPTAERQRTLIAHAIAPVWEANHVWLILVIVLLFACFPLAFATLTIALHVPLTLMLIGIVLRGSAFTFRSYDRPDALVQRRWSRMFAIASILAPFMLGVCAGAVLAGGIRVDPATGTVSGGYVRPWFAPFPFAVGCFVTALCAFLAATYLTNETEDVELRRTFRARAVAAAIATGALAWLCVILAARGAPVMYRGLLLARGAWIFHIVTAVVALSAIAALARERYLLARTLAIAQVALVVCGWALAQFPALVVPDVTLTNAAAPDNVLRAALWVVAAGAVVLLPSLGYLLRVFKSRPAEWNGDRRRAHTRAARPGRARP